MGASESKPEGISSMAELAISQEIEQDYGVKLPIDIIKRYMKGDICVIHQFSKTFKNMTEQGYEFDRIYQETGTEVSVWVKNGKEERRGWRIKK